MRVAFDSAPIRGRKTGIGVYTAQLVGALREFVPQVEPVLLEDRATADQRTDRRILREQFMLPRLAQANHADLMHLTGFAAPLRSRVPVILTVMDLIGVMFSENFPPVSRFYWSRYLPFTFRAAREVITPSENTRRDVIRLARVSPERITVIPLGVDVRFQPISDRQALRVVRDRLSLPARFFLFVSTLEPRKGIDTLVEAYASVAAQVSEHLVIVGKHGWYYRALFDRVRALDLENCIHFLDYLDEDDLPAVYNLATAFVFPSRYEGFGLTPLEAMACGAPVISSNASSLPEVIGDAGILVSPNDSGEFARAMLELSADDSLRRVQSLRGVARAKQFSWERAAHQTTACYRRALRTVPFTAPISTL